MSILNDDQTKALQDSFPLGKRELRKKEAMSPALRKRAQRARDKAAKDAQNDDERSYHLKQRALLPAETLKAMLEQEQRVRDVMASMELAGEEVPEEWKDQLDFISVEEATKEVIACVKEHEVVHLGYISKNELPGDWSSQKYWRDSELMGKLTGENEQTAQYVKYGLLTALPDWQVVEFLEKKAGWSWQRAADFVGYRIVGNTCCYGRGKTLFEAWGHTKEVKTPPAKPVTTIHIPEQAGSYQPPAPSIKDKDDA